MPRKKSPARPVSPLSSSAFEQAWSSPRAPQAQHPMVSGRWLLSAAGVALAAAAACGWLTLCLLFWQGGWQLLYHPASAIARTPASLGIPFDSVGFATTEAGQPRLQGWWIPAATDARLSRYTVLYLHGQTGNLGDAVDSLAALHAVGVNILAFDYRGYGQSEFAHPSERRWREDAEWALAYLTATRHVAAGSIIVEGSALGANLALEVAAAHPELAGVVVDEPIDDPADAIFNDARAKWVPAHLLVKDRFDERAAALALRTPSLWFLPASPHMGKNASAYPEALQATSSRYMVGWVDSALPLDKDLLWRWLDELPQRSDGR